MFAKHENISAGTIRRSRQGFFAYDFHKKGKVLGWLKIVHLPTSRQDLQCFVQYFQASIFFVAHYHILVLIDCIIMIVG